ncbi:hypothetical protein Tdes44962_MAKER08187 [Teratosphaeria destructans]|uniref:Uncharacterized protein n=1 Tax=Teratosphaeria destructans TaxID=418781 RepID=A0A9W7SWW6_9PEZI|nr:hypothetical protein Tdes44962_MAKER08187 [Teratosphaeria destructans]
MIDKAAYGDCVVARDLITYASEDQAVGSSLLRLFVDLHSHEANGPSFRHVLNRVAADFVLAVAREFDRLACARKNCEKQVSEVFNQRSQKMERCRIISIMMSIRLVVEGSKPRMLVREWTGRLIHCSSGPLDDMH